MEHCPLNIGCRALIKPQTNSPWFDINDEFTFTLTVCVYDYFYISTYYLHLHNLDSKIKRDLGGVHACCSRGRV